jgi:predicted nucleic acid-binding protein
LILYLDTSALVKLYVRERGSANVRRLVEKADAVATSIVAYAEARAAFARLRRERPSGGGRHRERVEQLDRDWEQFAVVELTQAVAHSAGELAERHALRGFDAIHLASALWLKGTRADDLAFEAFDRPLTAGAKSAGLTVAGPAASARRRPS